MSGHKGYTTEPCPECAKEGVAQTSHRLIEPPDHKTGTRLIRECVRCKPEIDELEK